MEVFRREEATAALRLPGILRSSVVSAVEHIMAGRAGCVVGVDGLPLGTWAVAVVDGAIVAEFELTSDGGRPLDLEHRVHQAVRLGGELARCPVVEVRLAVLDDGSTGSRLHTLTARLEAADVALRIVDLAGTGAAAAGSSLEGSGPESLDPSALRARVAALGGDGAAGS